MELASVLTPAAVKTVGGMTSKKRLLKELGDVAADCYGLDAAAAVIALHDRESIGPTGVGHGVALPHARLGSLSRVVGVFLRLEKPLDFGSIDGQPVDLVFALFAPDDCGVAHLKALAATARVMRDPAICAKLRANESSDTLYTILTATQNIRAA